MAINGDLEEQSGGIKRDSIINLEMLTFLLCLSLLNDLYVACDLLSFLPAAYHQLEY